MKRKVLRVLLPCLIVLTVVLVFGVVHLVRSFDYSGEMFSKSYRGCLYLYNTSRMNATMSDEPVYCISDTGKLLVSTSLSANGESAGIYSAKEKTGRLRRFSLTEKNFDILLNDDYWVAVRDFAEPFNGKRIRDNTVESWCYRFPDGEFIYLLRQENGDVLWCSGKDKISEILVLQPVGEQDLFYARLDEKNAQNS